MRGSKRAKTAYWIFTILFCLMMGFTVYAQLCLPQVAQVFSHLGFPNYFRIELCWAKLAGLLVLIMPMAPPRLKEWAYAGFRRPGLRPHRPSRGRDGPGAWSWSVGYLVRAPCPCQLPHDCAFLSRPGFRTARQQGPDPPSGQGGAGRGVMIGKGTG